MAATLQASRLTEAHRLAQARLSAQAVARSLAAWAVLDPDDMDGTTGRWLSVMLPLLAGQRRASATLAANYLSRFRAMELGAGAAAFAPLLADELDRAATTTGLVVTGPVTVRRALARKVDISKALDLGKAMSARAGARHVLNGGRETILDTVKADPKALGWARVASGRACAFCAMLASRGAVYKADDTADFEAHDGCSCSSEAVYRDDAALPAGSDRYADLYQQAKADTADGDDVLNTLRRTLAGT